MPNVPLDTRFIGIAPQVNLTERKSALINAETQPYSMQDIVDTAGGGSYLKYVAVLKQEDTEDPVAIVLENTLGEVPVWSRDSEGSYRLSAVNEVFKTNKTVCFIGHNYDTPQAIWQFGRADGNGADTERVVWLTVLSRATGSLVDISSGGSSFYDTCVEVRVYP